MNEPETSVLDSEGSTSLLRNDAQSGLHDIAPLAEFAGIASRSPGMRQVLRVLCRLAPTNMTITFMGETGTGKDVLAHAVHRASPRAAKPFVVLDCASIESSLTETELMGHEQGGANGAVCQYAGALERADGGTLFIDEVGELTLELQLRLLRVLESRKLRRIGGAQERAIDVRVLAATHRELEADVAAGRFRRDLYYRLAAAVVRVPSLRERQADIALLIPCLLADLQRPDVTVDERAIEWIASRPWHGNVRELKNALSYALAFVEQHVLTVRHLESVPCRPDINVLERLPLAGIPLESLERVAIQQTLTYSGGNKMQAARELGIAVSTLYEKLKRYRVA
jgi:two-component system, NtrC family, response regulator GlrR